MCQRQCSSIATKLSRLDAFEKRKVIRWCRKQASSHNSQGVVKAGSIRQVRALQHQTGAQCSAFECTSARVAVRNVVAPAPQPEPANLPGAGCVMSACCEVTQGVGDTWATRPMLLRGIWVGSKGQGFVVVVDFQLTFGFLVVEVDNLTLFWLSSIWHFRCNGVWCLFIIYNALVDFHVSTETDAKLISSFLISTHVFLCTELIFNYTLVVQLALNLSMASKFESNLK